MKIKAKVSERHREWIEDQYKCYVSAIKQENERHKKDLAEIKSRLKEYKDFWENNTKEIFLRENRKGGEGFFETERISKTFRNKININTLKPARELVCKYCDRIPAVKYVSCSDSRYDETYYTCDCKGARKNGKPWGELK